MAPSVMLLEASPEESASKGAGMRIRGGLYASPFGPCLIGRNDKGICHLSFPSASRAEVDMRELASAWPAAEIIRDNPLAQTMGARIFHAQKRDPAIPVFVHGTEFQLLVWRALLEIPAGSVLSYGALARDIGHPGASRATGTAVGKNEIAYLVPCHRVIRADGATGSYRWGNPLKQAILDWEARPVGG